MRRSLLSLCVLFCLTGCGKKWTSTIIKKRVYLDGYYVHVPSRRFSEKYAYAPPSQYPTAAQRTAAQKHYRDSVDAHNIPENQQIPLVDTTCDVIASVNANPFTYDTACMPFGYFVPYTYRHDTMHPVAGNGYPYHYDTIRTPYGYYIAHTDTPFVRVDTIRSVVRVDSVIYRYITDTVFRVVQRDTVIPLHDTLGMANHDSIRGTDSTALTSLVPKKKPVNWPEGEVLAFAQGGLYNGPQSAGYPVQWNSFSTAFGLRYKMDLKKQKALVFDFGYRYNRLVPGQHRSKQPPFLAGEYDHERLAMHDMTFAFCGRYNFRRVEDQPQRWMDVGLYADLTLRNSDVAFRVDTNSPLGDKVTTTIKVAGVSYLKAVNYGVAARFGKGIWSGFAMYRLNDLTSFGNSKADLPKIILGVDITLGGD